MISFTKSFLKTLKIEQNLVPRRIKTLKIGQILIPRPTKL